VKQAGNSIGRYGGESARGGGGATCAVEPTCDAATEAEYYRDSSIPLRQSMKAIRGQTVFRLADGTYTWNDVVAAAGGRPEWAALVRRSREGIACLAHLDAAGLELPEEAIDRAAEEFRYERDLISGDDAEAWLARLELSVDEWLDHIRRRVLRAQWAPQLEALVSRYPVEAEALDEAVWVDAVCTGEAFRQAVDLAQRAAAAAAAGERPDVGTPPERREAVSRGMTRFREMAISAEAVAREIALHHLEWIRVDCRVLAFEDAEAAREAALCVREDGVSFDDLADEAHLHVYEARFYLDELEEEARSAFAAAKPLEFLGPIGLEGRPTLCRVLDKVMPGADDPALVERAETLVFARALRAEADRRVTWEPGWVMPAPGEPE
jgi:hypothetical protein